LAEQGVPGLLFVLGLLGFCLHLGFKLHRQLNDPEQARLAMGVFLGLMTYFVHGVLNNYLDTDKASALFWGFFALLLVWDRTLTDKDEQKSAAAS
jgi:O-antigen ligase